MPSLLQGRLKQAAETARTEKRLVDSLDVGFSYPGYGAAASCIWRKQHGK